MPPSSSVSRRMTPLKILNLVFFVLNALVVYGIGVAGFFGATNNAELSERYQTLITPVGWAFAIWGIIFGFQGLWAILQLFVDKDYVGFGYLGVCLCQIAWALLFGFELIYYSLGAMIALLFSLVWIVRSQLQIQAKWWEWLFFKFPFAIHCGWIVAATLVNVNVVLVYAEVEDSDLYFYVALASLAILVLDAALFLFATVQPVYEIAWALAWATLGIFVELSNPKQAIQDQFSKTDIQAIQYLSIGASIFLLLLALGAALRARKQQANDDNKAGGYVLAPDGTSSRRGRRQQQV